MTGSGDELHPFDRAMRLTTIDAATVRGRTDPAWANMVGPFGGITAAVLLHAAESHSDRAGDPLALTVNFAAPIADGEFDITLRPARTNRSNQHWTLELTQDGEVRSTATMLFGKHRDTWADTEARPPETPAPEDIMPSGFIDMIVWAKRYDMRFAAGAVPAGDGTTSESSRTTLWVRDAAGRRWDAAALSSAADVFYPRVYLRRGIIIPAGTISLTTYFHATSGEIESLGADFVLASAHAHGFAHGYFDQSAHLWARDGRLLLTTHQLVYFKD